ncbi:MAG: GIY-YIG nuclease family protein [Gammaproteobacteria bacterium]|nr:GIY-YIG nuclease family protein [Gammaproteobacteria bacterium]
MMNAIHYTYILASKRRGALFVGTTPDLIDCVSEHKGNLVDGVTSHYAIHRLVYFERFDAAGPALLREAEIKLLPRCLKLHLIERQNPDWDDLYEFIAEICAQPSQVSA